MLILNQISGFGVGGSRFLIPFSADFIHTSSGYVYRSMGVPTNNLKWSFVTWIEFDRTGVNVIFGSPGGAGASFIFERGTSGNMRCVLAGTQRYISTLTFTGTGVWQPLVLVYDAANATEADRIKVFLDGAKLAATSTSPLNQATGVNENGTQTHIGHAAAFYGNNTDFHDGRMAQTAFLDGIALSDAEAIACTSGGTVPIDISTLLNFTGNNSALLDYVNSGALGTDAVNANDFTVSGTVNQSTDTPTS